MFTSKHIRGLMLFLLTITVCMSSASAGTALASSGVYPDSPVQIGPLEYGGGNSTVKFSFASYTYNDGAFVGYPIAFYIELYQDSTLIADDYIWSTTVEYSPLSYNTTYSWRVFAIYEFYDEYGEYCGMEYSDWSPLASFLNIANELPPVPIPLMPKYYLEKRVDDYAGGISSVLFLWPEDIPALEYEFTVAKDSSFSQSQLIDTLNLSFLAWFTHKLPADGSRIYWRARRKNAVGWSGYSQTASFINDCYMPSKGSGGALGQVDTCSDDYAVYNITGYLLKDISRRGSNRMKTSSAIITGLNSSNAAKLIGEQIVPLHDSDNNWETPDPGDTFHEQVDATAQRDAIHAQVYTGKFYDYLRSTFRKRAADTQNNLNSYDGNGSSMYNLIDIAGPNCGDLYAYWNTDTWNVHFCKAAASNYPEFVGHEWGHAVAGTASTRGNASLGSASEPGALDEAFSDWLGMAFKHATTNDKSWVCGGNRNFANLSPNYKGAGYNQNDDIYVNRNIPDTMFYLLSAGGKHPASEIKVNGIGIVDAMQIAFRANMEYWKSGDSFLTAANGMIKTVEDNLVQDPNFLYQVKNAWAAVGVCEPPPPEPPTGYIDPCGLPKIIFVKEDSKGAIDSTVKVSTLSGKQKEPVWGQNVAAVAMPKTGYTFVNWTENGALFSDSPSISFPATSDRTLTANFAAEVAKNFSTIDLGQSSPQKTITFSNGIQSVMFLGQAQLSGTNPADFSIVSGQDTCSGSMLNRYTSCTIQLVFTPQAAGLRNAVLNIVDTDGPTLFSYPLVGNGFAASIAVSSSSTTGGTVSLSGSQLWGGTATATATSSPGYAFNGWLEDGVTVSSAPSYSFTVMASRSLLAMFASTPPVITSTPSSGYFGSITTGTSSPERTFTITNSGLQPLMISSITLSGINRAEFGVTYNACEGTLSPNSSCSIRMNFTPITPSTKTARLNFTSNDPSTPTYVLDLSGYGGTPVMLYSGGFSADYYSSAQTAYNNASNGAEVRLWAADFNESLNCNRPVTTNIRGGYNGNFADKVGKSALQGALTISSGTVIIDGLQIGGTSYRSTLSVVIDSPGAGTVTSSPGAINCTGSCSSSFINGDQITLTAAPIGDSVFIGWSGGGCSGTGNCTVTVSDDIKVTALFRAAKIAVAPASESLGNVFVGTTSAARTIIVTSSGTQELIIGSLSLTGTDVAEFAKTGDTCSNQTLAPAATCTAQILFSPSTTGAKTASLLIPSNDPQTPVFSVSLNGIGSLPTIFVYKTGNGEGTVTGSPAGINCGSSCTADYMTNSTVTIFADPDFGYTFTGWSGACSGTGSCTLTMSTDRAVTATFTETPIATCSANPVFVNGSLYPSMQAAYNASPNNSIIKLLAIDFTESFIANRAITVIIDGGYPCSFTANPSETVIHGSPAITNGDVTMMNIRISQ